MSTRAASSKIFSRQVALAICLLFFLGGRTTLRAQDKIYRPRPNYVQIGKPDQAEGRKIIESFRQGGLPGDLYLEFELQVMPRRGETRLIPARLWTGRNALGPIWRLELVPQDAGKEIRLLVQNGPKSALWRWQSVMDGGRAEALGPEGLFVPLGETDLTAFDLQMQFLFWDDFVFEGVARVRGRPAHVFLMYPPANVAAVRPVLCGVRVYLDTQFNALVQAEQIGANEAVLKSITILDLKKVDDQWIPKTIDVRDDETRNKTRFSVRQAAVKLDLLPSLFEPSALSETIRPPSAKDLRDVGP